MRLRKESRAGAWADLQERLMTNLGTLVPDVTGLKDLLTLNRDIEEFMKTEAGSQSLDPAEALQRFLNSPTPSRTVPTLPNDAEDDDSPGRVQ